MTLNAFTRVPLRRRPLVVLSMLASTAGCAQWLDPPQSVGDLNAGYRYVAIDPLPVSFDQNFSGCPAPSGAQPGLMDALPDLASRVSTEDITGEASGSVPGVSVSGSGRSFRVTQDFIAYDTARLRFEVPPELLQADASAPARAASRQAPATQIRALEENQQVSNARNHVITVPVYVGVGLRLTSNLQVRSGKVNLSDLGALSAAVRADRVRGDLVSQALGLGGPKVVSSVPLPGELNSTTIQAATVAMGQIRMLLYDAETRRWPRVVGIHYPFERVNPALVNAIVAALVTKRIEWHPCATDDATLRLLAA